jgi:hypothetical protein
MKSLAKKFAPPTRAQFQLLEAAATITEQPDAAELAFMARQLVQCTLPRMSGFPLKARESSSPV